jgi:S1-C subfamily serine protease
MAFFLSPDEQVYARYGGRDAKDADNRQSLDGLRYTMLSVLAAHRQKVKAFAPRSEKGPKSVRDLVGWADSRCYHCHEVKEALINELDRSGRWSRDQIWRYPLPDNLGFVLEVDRGNVVGRVEPGSPAARAGLAVGDVLRRLGGVPVHSFADAQFALDKAPAAGSVDATWKRGAVERSGKLTLPAGWKKTPVTWRASLRHLVPTVPLYGQDLTAAQKKALGLAERQLAFRQEDRVQGAAKEAGVRPGDVILGVDDRRLELDADGFRRYVRREYLAGDRVWLNLVRDGKPLKLPLTLGSN